MQEEKALFGDSVVYLSFIPVQELDLANIPSSTSHCFPVKDGKVLFTVNPRGIDIIGGHIEPGESGDEAFFRESLEEGCIVPLKYELVGAIQVDNRENQEKALAKGYPLVGYQLIYSVTEFEEKPFVITHECVDRKYLSVSEIKEQHHNWLGVHEQALQACLNRHDNKLKIKHNM